MNTKYIKPASHEKTRVASVRITEAQKQAIDAINFNLSAFVRDKLDEALSGEVSENVSQKDTFVLQSDTTLLKGYKFAEIKQILLLLFEIDKLLRSAQNHFQTELIYNFFTIIDFLEVNKAELATIIGSDIEVDAATRQLFDFLTQHQFGRDELDSFFQPRPV